MTRGPYNIIPRTHARVEIKYIAGNKKLDSDELKTYIQELLDESLRTIIMEVEIWINSKVAKREGDLRESLIKFLKRSIPPPSTVGELRGIRLVLGVGAEIDYAKYVNKMTMSRVRHMGTWLEHSGAPAMSRGKPIFLDDPRAVGFYHDKMVDFGKERFHTNVDKAKYKYNSGA